MKQAIGRKWILLLPCIAFGAYAYYLKSPREAPLWVPVFLKTKPAKRRLVLDRISVQPPTSEGYDTDVVMYMIPEGPWSDDLINPKMMVTLKPGEGPRFAASPRCRVFYQKNGKRIEFLWPKGGNSVIYMLPSYSRDLDRFVMRCSLNLAAIPPHLKPLECRMHFDLDEVKTARYRVPYATAQGSVMLRQLG